MRTLNAFVAFVLAFHLLLTQATAQDGAVVLTLEDAISLALEKSYNARSLRLQLQRAEQNRVAARGRFKTSADLVLEAPNLSEQVQDIRLPNELPRYNTVGTLQWRGRLRISQPLPTNGSISLSSDMYHRRESVFLDQLNRTDRDKRFLSSFRLEFQQPLLVPNSLKLNLERANLRLEQAQRQFTRTQLDVVYNVTQAFYNFYRARRQLEIAQDEVKQQEKSYELARKKYEAGLIPEVEALQMEVDLAQSRNALLEAEGNLARSADQFKITVGLPLEADVTVRADLELRPFEVDEAKAIQHGLQHRAEIREGEINRRLAQIAVRETDARTAVKGEIRAFFDLTGVSDPFLSYNTGPLSLLSSSLDDLRRRPHNRGILFNLSVPIWDSGVNRAEVEAAKASLEQRRLDLRESKRRVMQQIRSAITRFHETRNRLKALKKSEQVAQRSYEISLARFDNGDITSQELALDRDRLTQARLAYLDAYIQYQLAVADLKRQTLYDFEKNRSLVEESP